MRNLLTNPCLLDSNPSCRYHTQILLVCVTVTSGVVVKVTISGKAEE